MRARALSPNPPKGVVTQQGPLSSLSMFSESASPIQYWAENVKGNIRLLGDTVLIVILITSMSKVTAFDLALFLHSQLQQKAYK